jgi:hypothetical protein
MAQLLRMFVDIAIWRRGPQDLPASTTLLGMVSVCYVLVTAIQAGIRGWDLRSSVLLLIIDLVMQAAWLWSVLAFFARRSRFLQTFCAFLGVSALLTLLDALMTGLLGLMGVSAASQANPWPFFSLGLMLMSLGRILQQALERSLFLGMALVLVIMLTIAYVAQGLLPGM